MVTYDNTKDNRAVRPKLNVPYLLIHNLTFNYYHTS